MTNKEKQPGSGTTGTAGEGGLMKTVLGSATLVMGMAALPVHAGPTIPFGEQGFITINYALQTWMQYRDFRSATNNADGWDTFLRRNRVTLSGQYNDSIGFYAQLEANGDSRNGVDDRSVFYRDAYITYDKSDAMRFIVGRFKNTFSRENLEACLEPLTIDRAEVISYTPFGGTRDTGIAMWGNLADASFQYRVMLSDGRESNNVAKDSPRVTARAHWSLWDPEYDYGYRGTYLGTQKVLTFGIGYDFQANAAYADFTNRRDAQDYSAWTADVFMEYPTVSGGTWTASAAYFDYSAGNAINQDPDPELPQNSELEAYYLKAGYMLPGNVGPGRLQFFYRHENSDYASTSRYYDNTWNSIGFNYYIHGQQLKVSFEYADVSFDREHPSNPALQDYNQATLGLQFIF